MKQNCEKMQTKQLKTAVRCFVAPRSIFNPCLHLPMKWTFVHLEWSKIMKKYRLSEFFLEEDGRAG